MTRLTDDHKAFHIDKIGSEYLSRILSKNNKLITENEQLKFKLSVSQIENESLKKTLAVSEELSKQTRENINGILNTLKKIGLNIQTLTFMLNNAKYLIRRLLDTSVDMATEQATHDHLMARRDAVEFIK